MQAKQLCLLACSCVFSLSFADRVYSIDISDMVALYVFEEGSGPTVADITGNGHDATFDDTSGTTDWAPGKFGGALEFTNSSVANFAVVPHHEDFNYGFDDFSVGTWINATKDDANAVTKRNGSNGWWTLTAGLDDTPSGDGSGVFVFEGLPEDGDFANYVIESAATEIVDVTGSEANWHHIAAIRRSGVVELWTDGVKEFEFDWNFSFDNENELRIGGWNPGSENLEGRLDEVFISRAGIALTEEELQCIMGGLEVCFGDGPALPGDVNRDGVVDLQDFEIIRTNFLQSVTGREEGDLTRDGVVDLADFRAWKDNRIAGVGVSANVPEPNCLMIVILTATGLVGLSRRRHRVY